MKTLKYFVLLLPLMFIWQIGSAEPVPHLINYQGKLTGADGNALATGDYTLSFKIYNQASGGTPVWGPQTFTNIPVAQGHFNVILGQTDDGGKDITSAFTDGSAYLEITVNNGSPIQPRQRILSAPYALVSDTVRGNDLYADPGSGNVGVKNQTPQATLHISGQGGTAMQVDTQAKSAVMKIDAEGHIEASEAPTQSNHVVTKAYVDSVGTYDNCYWSDYSNSPAYGEGNQVFCQAGYFANGVQVKDTDGGKYCITCAGNARIHCCKLAP